ncbi:MAG: HAD family hydrolase [bacterium]|nr:HAD family hydrolase [bacterium]
MSKKPAGIDAVFLDRDGVINEELGYQHNHEDIRMIAGSAGAIRRLNELSIPVIVVSNQSGVARGYFPESHVGKFNDALSKELKKEGAHIDKFYYCPHHPEGKGNYKKDCDCRKPKPGLLFQAAKEMNIDLKRSVITGDKASDIGAGVSVGSKTVLVMTGYGKKEWSTWNKQYKPNHVALDLSEAVKWLLAS